MSGSLASVVYCAPRGRGGGSLQDENRVRLGPSGTRLCADDALGGAEPYAFGERPSRAAWTRSRARRQRFLTVLTEHPAILATVA
jgi:hypothetical protein